MSRSWSGHTSTAWCQGSSFHSKALGPWWQLSVAGTHQVCDGGTPGTHRAEGSMPWRIQECQRLLAPWHGHLKGANVLQAGGSVRALLGRFGLEGVASMATINEAQTCCRGETAVRARQGCSAAGSWQHLSRQGGMVECMPPGSEAMDAVHAATWQQHASQCAVQQT